MRIGIDLGGTKIEAAAIDDAGELRARRRVATPPHYDDVLGTLVQLVRAIEREVGEARSVGIGTPGGPSPKDGLMQNAENTALQGQPFERDLARVLDRPTRLANDAACFALSEAIDGAGTGARVVFGVIVGTGCGGGIVVDGRVLSGANATGCEWGHNPISRPTPREAAATCTCGRRACVEAFLSGPAIARDHREVTGEALPAEKIAARALEGSPGALATIERYVDRMARALAPVINLLDPDVIVLGGGVSGIEALYAQVPARWGRWIAADPVRTRLVRARHGDASGVRGAARLWP
jgi:fructokinase